MNSYRSRPATEAQFVALVELLELNPELARGHKNVANARLATQTFWEEVATRLNRIGGATKTKSKWMKYWTDRKSNIKKKAAERAAARRRTGGGFEEVRRLTDIEERVLHMLGGEGYAVGDSHLRYPVNQQSPGLTATQSTTSPSILTMPNYVNTQETINTGSGSQGDDSVTTPTANYGFTQATIHTGRQGDDADGGTPIASYGFTQATIHTGRQGDDADGGTPIASYGFTQTTIHTGQQGDNGDTPIIASYGFEPASPTLLSPAPEDIAEDIIVQSSQPHPPEPPLAPGLRLPQTRVVNNPIGDQGPSRQPPTQRRSQMVSIAERFLRLEERRLALDENQAQTNRITALAFRDMAAASQTTVQILNQFLNRS